MTDPIHIALDRLHDYAVGHPNHDTDEIVEAAIAAIAAEREACARICDKQYERARTSTGAARADACATAIRARATLAQPEPEGVTDEEIEREALKNADSDDEYRAFKSGAFFVQERISRPAIEPVSVAERPWEREGWCDAEGFCWEGSGWTYDDANEVEGYAIWALVPANKTKGDFSLPHHALPVPGACGEVMARP